MKPRIQPLFNATHQPARVSFTMSEPDKDLLIDAMLRSYNALRIGRLSQKYYDITLARYMLLVKLLNAPGFAIYYSLYTERDHTMARAGYVYSAQRWGGNGSRRVIKSLAGYRRDQLLFDNFSYDRDHSK